MSDENIGLPDGVSEDENPFLSEIVDERNHGNGADDASAAPTDSPSSTVTTTLILTPPTPQTPVEVTNDDKYLRISVFFLSFSMFFNFAMFAPVQNVVTTIYPDTATTSLILIYTFFTLGTIVAPSCVRYVTAGNGCIIGSIGYLSYTLACLTGSIALIYICSIIIGLCASMIWTSSGVVVTTLSTTLNRGAHSAIMIGCVRAAAVFSNLLTGYILNATTDDGNGGTTTKFSNEALYLLLFILGSCGLVGFLALRIRMRNVARIVKRREEFKIEQEEYLASIDPSHPLNSKSTPLLIATAPSISSRLVEIFRLLGQENYRHLFPILFIVQGFGNGYYFGQFGVVMGKSYLGFAQAAMGVTAVTFITTLGRTLDRIPLHLTYVKKYFLYATMAAHILFYILSAITASYSNGFTSHSPESDMPRDVSSTTFSFLVYTTSICFGMAWSGSDITNLYLVGQIFSKQSETAFAAKPFSESAGFVVSQFLLYVIPPKVYPILAAIWTIPVIVWYAMWKFPAHLVQSKSIVPAGENNSNQSETEMVGTAATTASTTGSSTNLSPDAATSSPNYIPLTPQSRRPSSKNLDTTRVEKTTTKESIDKLLQMEDEENRQEQF